MVLGKKTGCCTICKKKGRSDWHHIISQHHARRTGQEELITDPNNVIELCRRCHDQTTASMVRKRLNKQGKPVKKSGRPMKRVLPKVQAKLSASEIRRISKLNEQERIQDCKKRLELREVMSKDAPNVKFRYFLEYLGAIQQDDVLAEKWHQYLRNTRNPLRTLYPIDHWGFEQNRFDGEMSQQFEDDGFIWLENGSAWKSGLTLDRMRFEMELSNIRARERTIVEELQIVAAEDERKRRLDQFKEDSELKLEKREVFIEDSPATVEDLVDYISAISVYDESAKEWMVKFNSWGDIQDSNFNPLTRIYPVDHWLHDEELFERKESDKFEGDGFCWTKKGGAWKVNLSDRQAMIEKELAEIRGAVNLILKLENDRLETEKIELERVQAEIESKSKLSERGMFLEDAPIKDSSRLVLFFRGTRTESEVSEKWADFFAGNTVEALYPADHWMHSPEIYDEEKSKEFEGDGFVWTDGGGSWIPGLTLVRAAEEEKLAKAKQRQRKIISEQEARLAELEAL
tara:strand:+ start:54 stop:1601 length:1548 start_codon:yes stop_codon:yes gene_type:complete